jgi:hypothetical protein
VESALAPLCDGGYLDAAVLDVPAAERVVELGKFHVLQYALYPSVNPLLNWIRRG